MKEKLLKTNKSYGPLVLRLGLGIMMFPHGAQKMMGWFGGHGFSGTMTYFTENMHIPAIFAFLAIVAEFFGAIGLITGFLTRISAFGVGFTMLVAGIIHINKGKDFDLHILAVAISIALIIQGSGALGFDKLFMKKKS